ncbi:hypothetical protein SUGI_0914670 [Cryptomeria japonica]|nr:hypothetical protein SUGI_0914670 [Cryptomeria japonica]
MTKGVYVLLLFSLLTAPFAYASHASESESDVEENDHGHPGYCRAMSGEFHGECVQWRKGECQSVCTNAERHAFGECDWGGLGGLVCWCYDPCP